MSLISIRHNEIIEIEVDFLLIDFSSKVSRYLDDTIELIITGSKLYCYRTLAFTMKSLHNEDFTLRGFR